MFPAIALGQAVSAKSCGCPHVLFENIDVPKLLTQHEDELGVGMVPMHEMVCVDALGRYVDRDEVPSASRTFASRRELDERLAEGREIPGWFTSAEVATGLRKWRRAPECGGCTIFFTGLSGSGKSTIANVLLARFLESGDRAVMLLDGDLVRKTLSADLGFSKEHREVHVRRIASLASEITKAGGIAICASIAPYDDIRKAVRETITALGGFVLVYLSTPLEVCEGRDTKGLYAKARAGIVKHFTGISDPYEPPDDADIVIDTTDATPDESVKPILLHLERQGFTGTSH